MMLSRRLFKSLQIRTAAATALTSNRSYNNSRNSNRNSNSSSYPNQRNNNNDRQRRGQGEEEMFNNNNRRRRGQEDESMFLRNLNFRDGGGEAQSHTRHQRRDNNSHGSGIGTGISDFRSRRGRDADANDQEIDDFEQLFPDDSGNGKTSQIRRQDRSADVEFKGNRRSRYFGEEDSGKQPAALRDGSLDDNRVDDGDRIADTLLQGPSVEIKKVGREAEEERKQVLVEETLEPEDADEIFKKMKETGLIPNAVAMLDGLCKDGLVQEAMKLFGLMREKGTIPEVVIYTSVVEGFCKAAKYDDAKRIFKKMLNNGIEANAFSYTILIKGLCKGGKLEDAVEYCVEMLESNHLPNASTLVALVDGFCKEKGVEQAIEVVKRLHGKGFVLDDKAVREHLEKKGPFSPQIWEVIFGKKKPYKPI